MSSQISALKRIITKEEQNKFKEIILKNRNQVYIGRDIACNYRITNIEISRKHAFIEFVDNYWVITDLESTNGLFINCTQLSSNTGYRLINGDKVSFGPPNQSEFNYHFIANYTQNSNHSYDLSAINLATIPIPIIPFRIETDSSEQLLPTNNTLRFNIEPNVSASISLSSNMPTRSGVEYQINTVSVSTSNCAMNSNIGQRKKSGSRSKHNTNSNRSHALDNFIEHDYSRSSPPVVTNTEPVIKIGHKVKNSNKSKTCLKLKESLNKSKDSKTNEIEKKQKEMQKEKEKLEKVKKELDEKKESERLRIKLKEESLKARFKELNKKERENRKREEEIAKKIKQLSQEKQKFEESKDLKESDNNRKSSKRKLVEKVDANNKSVDMKRQCNEDKAEKERQKQVEEIFESEMTCSVCHEYFIHAVNLNCSHTFCFACIEEWKSSNGGKHVCPMCRKGIENQNRELVVDNLIDRFVAKMKPNLIEHRKALIEERKKKLEKRANNNESNSRRNNGNNNNNRGGFAYPGLHFFLRDGTDVDFDPDSSDVNVIGFGYGGNYVSSISSSSSSSSSSSEDSSDSDDHSSVSIHSSDDDSDDHQSSASEIDIDSDTSRDSVESEVEEIEDNDNDNDNGVNNNSNNSYINISSDLNDSESDLESMYGEESEHSYRSDSIHINYDSDSGSDLSSYY